MKNKTLLFGLLLTGAFSLSACTNFVFTYNVPRYPGDVKTSTSKQEGDSGTTDEEDVGPIDKSKNYNIKIWCAPTIETLTKSQVNNFIREHDYKINLTVDAVGEDSAATHMLEDVSNGADLFVFAQDQLNRLKTAGALAAVSGNQLNKIKIENSAESVDAATLNSKVYAYPFTSDNGYFLMYDKTVVKPEHVGRIEDIIADCVAADKNINYNIFGSGFYTASYFMATGCSNLWMINSKNAFYKYEDNYNSEKGMIACKAIRQIAQYPIFSNGDDPTKLGKKLGACVTGMWNYSVAKDAIGDNLGCAKMPTFTVDGQDYNIGSYSGYKLLGVKPQEDTNKVRLCKLIARYLSGQDCQEERFNAVEWGPTNNVVSALDKVKQQPGLKALEEQKPYAHPQTACPSGWFDAVQALATGIKANSTDADLQKQLTQYVANIDDLVE